MSFILKTLFCSFILFSCSISLFAQEFQTTLGKNPNYQYSPYKTIGDEDNLCGVNSFLDFEIVSIVEPDCTSDNGSIDIIINATDDSFEYYLNGDLLETGTQETFSFTDLEAGPYNIEVVGNTGNICTQFILLSDDGEALDEDDFIIENAFCGLGRLRSKPAIGTQIFEYNIFDSDSILLETCSNAGLSICNLPLDIGIYYIQRIGEADSCQGFLKFEIEEIPSTDLPFLEDFSADLIYPNEGRWADKQAYVNRSFPINPLSIGVATLDGLDQNGLPYQAGPLLNDGPADSLTTLPFCMDAAAGADSLYLSFFFQPEGIGDRPNDNDSLILEVKDSEENWHRLWSFSGAEIEGDSTVAKDKFTFVNLTFTDDTTFVSGQTFFEDGFQFRFRNTATLNGLNDTWHLDFIRLNTNPTIESFNSEIAFVYEPLPLLNNYSAMPWSQFYDYQEKELSDSLTIFYRNNGIPQNADLGSIFQYQIFELCSDTDVKLDSVGELGGIINETIDHSFYLGTNGFEEFPDLSDQRPRGTNIVAQCEVYFDPNPESDIYTENDTVRYNQVFGNYMAYDDGSAERAYGFIQTPGELAIQFELNQPDTLLGIQIYFTNIVNNSADQLFSIKAWHSLDFENEDDFAINDSIAAVRSGLMPIYTGQIGGFTTYTFDQPVLVDSIFYAGFEQEGSSPLEVGQDINNLVLDTIFYFGDESILDTIIYNSDSTLIDSVYIPNPDIVEIRDYKHRLAGNKTFINPNGTWERSIIPGAIMVRPILSGRAIEDTWMLGVEEVETETQNLVVYPNPANDLLNIKTASLMTDTEVRIFDYSGKLVQVYENQKTNLSIADFPTGMYLIQLLDRSSGKMQTGKFIKQ